MTGICNCWNVVTVTKRRALDCSLTTQPVAAMASLISSYGNHLTPHPAGSECIVFFVPDWLPIKYRVPCLPKKIEKKRCVYTKANVIWTWCTRLTFHADNHCSTCTSLVGSYQAIFWYFTESASRLVSLPMVTLLGWSQHTL